MFEIPKNSKILKKSLIVLITFFSLISIPFVISSAKNSPLNFVISLVSIFMLYIFAKSIKSIPTVSEAELAMSTVDNSIALSRFNWMVTTSLFVIVVFLGMGWEIFMYGLWIVIIFIAFMSVFNSNFKKYKASNLTIYTMLIFFILIMLSLKLNTQIATDSSTPSYSMEFLLGIQSGKIETTLFGTLINWTFIFFILVSIFVTEMVKHKGGIKKNHSIFIIIIALLLPAINIGYFLYKLPGIKIIENNEITENKEREIQKKLMMFDKTPEKILKTTFTDRVYSFFSVENQESKQDNVCNYTDDYVAKIAKVSPVPMSLNVTCSKKLGLFGAEYFPYATSTYMGVNLPFDNLKKGDIIAVVVKMDPDSYFGININGNNNKKDETRKVPFFNSGIKDYVKIGDVDYYEKSIVQFMNSYNTKNIMILYPVNLDVPVATINLDIGKYASSTPGSVEILEVSKISYEPFVEPEWLKTWSKEANPFLDLQYIKN